MLQEYMKELNLNKEHAYKQIDLKNSCKGGQDIDLITYEEYDKEGKLVRTFTIKDTTGIYPPFSRYISLK